MLRFREFRKNILEASGAAAPMEPDAPPEAPEPAAPKPETPKPQTPPPAPKPTIDTKAIADKIKKDIDNLIIQWVNDLKKELYTGEMQVKPRSLWDRFKGGLANMWYGRQNVQNPYYWKNRLGDELGVSSESQQFNTLPFTLEEYKDLRSFFDEFETQLKEEYEETPQTSNLRINQIINAKANELRQKLDNLLNQHVQSGALSQLAQANEPPAASGGSETPSPSSSPSPAPKPPPSRKPKQQREVVLPDGISNWKEPTPDMIVAADTLKTTISNAAAAPDALHAINNFNGTPEGKLWNDFGGGLVVSNSACPDLPKIIRFNHPLLTYFTRFNQDLLTQLKGQRRIETKAGDIKTNEDLKQRIRGAKGIHGGRTPI